MYPKAKHPANLNRTGCCAERLAGESDLHLKASFAQRDFGIGYTPLFE